MADPEVAIELRKLPSVDRVLQLEAIESLMDRSGRDLVLAAVRFQLERVRADVLAGQPSPSMDGLVADVERVLSGWIEPSLRPVINATGVVIHTNLGRAPLSRATREAMESAARGYSNLEYDLEEGERGSRYVHAERFLLRLTGAEAALVVNNNAGAVLLVLSALARDREVVISRGQLVEIGGGFRVPDVMRQSGATLVEVGTTNRTHPADYEAAIGDATAALLRVHHSNFRMVGFTSDVLPAELRSIADRHGVWVFDDLGSGTLLNTEKVGLEHEPTVQESVAAGSDLVTFSGDKLLGGPQCGIIVGRAALVDRVRRHPLTRALRVDKTTLAGVQATLRHYLEGSAATEVPVWRMMGRTADELRARAERWRAELVGRRADVPAEVIDGKSAIGGGSLPGQTLPTALLALGVGSPEKVARRLRQGDPPVIGRIEDDRLLLDPRTVLDEEDEALLRALVAALGAA